MGLVVLAAVTAGLAVQVGGAQAATTNLVTNPSVERVGGTKPYGWLQIGSGSNARTFRHLNGAAVDGRKFVRTMVTARRTGHAGWSFAPVKVVGGATYTYGDSYRSNTTTVLRARYVNAAGTVTYRTFAAAPRTTAWKKAGISFTIPRGTVRLSMERLLTSPGTLDVDATLLRLRSGPAPAPAPAPVPVPVPTPTPTPTPTPAPTTPQPGSRALVSVTFDDGSIDHFTAAGPVLAQQGIPGTFYLVSNFVNGAFYMSVDQARTLQAAGHELGGHTASHANLTTLTPEQRTAELVDSKTRLEGWFGPIRTLAYPFGAYNADVLAQVSPLYQTARTTEGGVNVPGSVDRTRLRMRYVTSATTAATVTQWMNEANTANAWTILVYHGIRTTNPDSETVTPDQFASHMAAVKASGLRTMTVSQAYAEVD